jgi:WD40 repeat protein/tetratricopeptide (TPR) repeat protein
MSHPPPTNPKRERGETNPKRERGQPNPFPGLRPFTQEEDYLFFGREEQTLELLERLAGNRFLAVVGTSGSGKSSLVRCGLLSQLLGGKMLAAGASWEVAVTHPGGNPLALLTEALLDAGLYDRAKENARENLLATLSRSHFGLVEAVKQAGAKKGSDPLKSRGLTPFSHRLGEGSNFLLVVDQFEEIFRFHEAGQEQQEAANEFVSLLLEATAQKEVPVYVVLTMRSDFIGECGQFEGLAEMVNRGEFLIPRLNREQYKRVIEGPIKVAGGKIAPRLLQRLLNDLGEQADQLPCLQHALMRTWSVWASNGDTGALDLDDYHCVGRMAQALSLHADEIYMSLSSDRQRALCQGIFQALTVEEANSRGIRRPQRLGRLCQILDVQAGELRPIIDAYRQSGVTFLTPAPEVELTEQTIIDISHESLMRVWTRLRQWVAEETQAAGIYRRLAESADLFAQGKAGLYRDPELGIALAWRDARRPNAAWAERYRPGFAPAIDFLEASRQASVAEEQAREAARRRELEQAQELADARQLRLEQQQRAARRLRWMIAGLAVVALVAGLACVAALVANKRANDAQQQAVLERDKSRQLSADLALDKGIALAEAGHTNRGLLWMLEALKTAPEDAEAFKKMIRWNLGAWLGQVHKPLRFIDTGGSWGECAFSPDGKTFAAGSGFNRGAHATPISLWDTASGRKLSTLSDAFASFAFRPDGKALIAYADQSRMVAIELASGRVLWTTPPLPGGWPAGIDFSADGSVILAKRSDPRAWLLRLSVLTGKECGERQLGWGRIAVAPGGKLAAVGRTQNGETYIDLIDLPSGRRTATWPAGAPALHQLLFSPDGKSLYVSAIEGDAGKASSFIARAWALDRQGRAGLRERPETSPLMASTGIGVYTPSGDRLVTGTENLLVVRDVTGRVRGTGFPQAGGMVSWGIAARPDGRTMLALSPDFHFGLWQISAEAEPVPDKQAAPTGNAPITRFRGFSRYLTALRADGQIAVSQLHDAAGREQVRLFDPATGRPLGVPAPHHPGWYVRSFAFSPDGRYFATGSNPWKVATGELRLWDTSTGRLLFPPIPHTNYVSAIAFHPEGKILATGDYSGLVRTWDISTGREIGRPLYQGEIVLQLSFSPDGKMLAVGLAQDRTGKPGTRLWDATTRQPISKLLPSKDNVGPIEFRPDGRALLVSAGNATQLWDTTQGRALTEPLIEEGPGGFRPDGRAFLTVGKDGSVKLRDATTGKVLGRFLTSSSQAKCAAFRGDGDLVAAGFEDGAVRLYDPATNQPVGPPRFMIHAVVRVAFTSDGRSVVAVDELGEARTWPVPEPLDGNLDDLTLRIEARTGLRMDSGLAISRLSSVAWQERIEQLGRLDSKAAGPDTDPAWHAPMIREAEQEGNAFAAIWHLDRLIAARPDDWLLYARRGRAWSLSDEFDKAAVDFRKAERLSSRNRVLEFQAHCVLDCTKAERWAAALWYLDRLIAARPKDGSLRLDRAAVYGKLGRKADRRAELARVLELGADEGVVIPRAEELGRAGHWKEAARLLAGCGRRGPLSQQLAQAWAIACLQAKDHAGYREACAADLAWQGANPTVVNNVVSAAAVFALGSKGLDDYRVPMAWFERRLSDVPVLRPVWRHAFWNAFGGLLLRAGRPDEAIVRIKEGIAAAKDMAIPSDWAYLALAHARKGKLAEARQILERLRDWRPDSSTTFWDVQEVTLLRSEAEALLGSRKEEPKK